jgi:2-dehydropantoate 2-reductase
MIKMTKLKLLIIGAGAMGCRFGICLLRGGADVILCDIREEHVNAINQNGLRVEEDDCVEYVKIPAITDVKDAGSPDAIMIFTKSTQTEEAIQSALAIMKPDTPVISLQNGLGNLELIEKYIEKDRIIAGCTKTATGSNKPGSIRIEGFAESDIMALGSRATEVCRAVRDTLEAGGMPCHISDNIMREIWQKLTFNSAMNTVTALTRQFPGNIGEYGVSLIEQIMLEVAKVAASEGVRVDLDALSDTIRFLTGVNGDKKHFTSMLQDVLGERQTEADYICEPIIRKAGEQGIAVPHLETVYKLIKIMDGNYRNQARL